MEFVQIIQLHNIVALQWGQWKLMSDGMQGFGYAVSLVGFFLYNYIKMQQMDKPQIDTKQQYTVLPQADPERAIAKESP